MREKIVLIDGHSILNRAFYGVPDLGRDLDVQPCDQSLGQGASDAAGSQALCSAGVSPGLDGDMVQRASDDDGGSLYFAVLQFCMDLGKRSAAAEPLYGLGLL